MGRAVHAFRGEALGISASGYKLQLPIFAEGLRAESKAEMGSELYSEQGCCVQNVGKSLRSCLHV